MKRLSAGGKRTKTIFWTLMAGFFFCCLAFDAGAQEESDLRVTRMEWRSATSELRVDGRGAGGRRTVTIKDAESGAVLGNTTSRRDGRWGFRKRNLPAAPCLILVEGDGSQALTAGYTQNEPEICMDTTPGRTLTEIIISGPLQVNENSGVQYVCQTQYSDGTSEMITETAVWTVDPTAYATIAEGALTASEVSGEQSVTISAGFEQNNIVVNSALTIAILDSAPGPLSLDGSHGERFRTYEGTQTCLECHTEEALAVHDSVHYQWRGDASEATGLADMVAGKLGGINDFCIYPDINWIGKLTNTYGAEVDGGCAKCHVGLGAKPTANPAPAELQAQLENIDCLVCHSDSYKRTVEMVDGSYRFVPDTAKMSVSIHQAAADITLPSKDSCLNCHTKAGGGDNFKRGDIEEYHRDPTRDFDVHMASRAKGGAGLDCLDCHTALDHKIAGRGSDLRPRELADQVACTNCHSPQHDEDIQKHTARVNCTVCHIPVFANVAGTDMDRDWSHEGGMFVEEKGLYEPYHVKETNVVPEYKFFNGLSSFYQFGDPVEVAENGRVVMSAPEGSIDDPAAKIYAFKRHQAKQPVEPDNGRLLPLKIGIFFQTGDVDTAVAEGAKGVNWPYSGHEFADTERYMGLFHEVAPKEQALSCNDCHNGGNRLDFAALGYTPKATYNSKPLCASCHEDESNEWPEEYFKKVHAKHVTDKKLDCGECHTF
jgi:hypothetical protein